MEQKWSAKKVEVGDMKEQETRPFDIFEVSISVPDIDKSIQQFRDLFGLEPYFVGDIDGYEAILNDKKISPAKIRMAIYHAGPVRLELVGPLDENDSIYAEYLRKHGPGVQHLGTRVTDLDYEIAWFKERGIEVKSSAEVPGIRIAYMDTESICGFHVELVQTHLREPGLTR